MVWVKCEYNTTKRPKTDKKKNVFSYSKSLCVCVLGKLRKANPSKLTGMHILTLIIEFS